MIEKVDITWNDNYKYDGIMYFAQRIIEMLSFYTIDIYRAPLMNTSSLINEYLKVCHGISAEYHSGQVLEEFKESFSKDIIINNFLGKNKVTRIINQLNKYPQNRQKIMEYLRHLICPQYLQWAKDYSLSIVPQGKEKEKIEKTIRCFLPELLNHGYSRDEIYHHTKQAFWREDKDPIELLNDFLNHYDLNKHSFTVYFGIGKELDKYKSIFKKRLNACFEDDGNFKYLDLKPEFIPAKISNITAIDAGNAAIDSYASIDYFVSYFSFFLDNTKPLLNSLTYVINEETMDGRRIIANPTKINLYTKEEIFKNPGKIIEKCIIALASKARCSVTTTDKLINLHNKAISNNGLENSFLNFWSMLEIICVKDPKKSKITQVIDITIPILQRDYLGSIFSDIGENLKIIFSKDILNTYLAKIDKGDNYNEKVACLVLLPEYSSLLDKITDEMQRYPVLRSRMLNLHDKYKKRNELYSLAEKYGKRIEWHMARIYRARNQITHSGSKPKNLKDLAEHLHSYVDSITCEILIKLIAGNLCHISNVLTDCSLLIEEETEYLKESQTIDIDTIKTIVSKKIIWH